MKRFSEQLKKKSDSIRLRASERSVLRDRLTTYMEYHPLPAELKVQVKKEAPLQKKRIEGIISDPFKAITINMTYVRNFVGVFTVFMVVGIPVVAERSVPGDMLYSVKTEITEELRASLKLSPYAKIEWETQRLERRVAEARLLASEGKLTPETEANVAQAIKEHTDAAIQEIATIRETNEDDAAIAEIAFASALSVQSDVLEGHIENDNVIEGTVGYSIVVLANMISEVSEEADVAQTDAAPSYDVLLGNVESQTTRAYELFESVKTRAGTEEILDIKRRLSDVERKLTQAIKLDTTDVFVPVVESSEEVVIEEVDTDVPVEEIVIETQDTSEESIVETELIEETEDVEVVQEMEKTEIVPEQVVEVVVTLEERRTEAVELLRAALTDVQKLIIFMTDIDVRENVTIEELVPMTLTVDEKTASILYQLDIVLEMQVDIASRILTEEVVEKTQVGTDLLETQLESVKQLLKEGNIDGAERIISEAHAVAQDVQKLVILLPVRGSETEEGVAAEETPLEDSEETILEDVQVEEMIPQQDTSEENLGQE